MVSVKHVGQTSRMNRVQLTVVLGVPNHQVLEEHLLGYVAIQLVLLEFRYKLISQTLQLRPQYEATCKVIADFGNETVPETDKDMVVRMEHKRKAIDNELLKLAYFDEARANRYWSILAAVSAVLNFPVEHHEFVTQGQNVSVKKDAPCSTGVESQENLCLSTLENLQPITDARRRLPRLS